MKIQDFKRKIKLVFFILFKLKGIAVTCGCCKSMSLDILESKQEGNIYYSKYKCRRCGAIAENKEIWLKE